MNRTVFLVLGSLLIVFGLALVVIPHEIHDLFDADRGLVPLISALTLTSTGIVVLAMWQRRALNDGTVVPITMWGAALTIAVCLLVVDSPRFVALNYDLARLFGGAIIANGLMTLILTWSTRRVHA